MQKFKIKIYGPSKSNPTDIFWYSRDTLRGFGFHEGSKVAVDWDELDEMLKESEEFQARINEGGLFMSDMFNERPSSLYEMLYPNERIDEYLERYSNRDRLNELFSEVYTAYDKMAESFIQSIKGLNEAADVDLEIKDGSSIAIRITDEQNKLSKEKIKEVLFASMKDYLSGLESPISYNFVVKGITFFRAELTVNDPDCTIIGW